MNLTKHDPALDKQVKAAKKKLAKGRKKLAKKTLAQLAKASAAARESIALEFRALPVDARLAALTPAIRGKKKKLREAALAEFKALRTPHAVIPLAVGSIAVSDPDFGRRARAAASEQHADFARQVYEYIAVKPGTKPAFRARTAQHLADIGDRRSVPAVLQATTYAGFDVRLTLLRSRGFRSVPVNLGSNQAAATQVDIELPQAELIQVNTSVKVPMEIQTALQDSLLGSLRTLSGQDFGRDLEAWASWWNKEEKKMKAAEASAADDSAEEPTERSTED